MAAGANLNVDVTMALAEQIQQVNVSTDTVSLSVDPENNASSTVITGAALDALSDDPDDLQAELTALAGPSAGPNGGQIYIDGFTGGQLPPKSSILAIRINQNPFSAQYAELGYGRIEVITKPGTSAFHGNATAPVPGQVPEYIESVSGRAERTASLPHAVLHGQCDGANPERDVVHAVRFAPRDGQHLDLQSCGGLLCEFGDFDDAVRAGKH